MCRRRPHNQPHPLLTPILDRYQPTPQTPTPHITTTTTYTPQAHPMAALLLGAIGLSAQKIKEAHTKKKDRKALLLYEAERAELRNQEKLRREEERRRRRLRRSGNSSRSGHAVSGWESDMAFFGEAPPPYEEVDSRGREGASSAVREAEVERQSLRESLRERVAAV